MNKALKKAIVCSLMVSFMQGGLVTPLIVAAQENNPQQNQVCHLHLFNQQLTIN